MQADDPPLMRRALIPLLLLIPLAACGPRTVVSMMFPTTYAATTVVDFIDGDRTLRQTVVTACRVVDQTDSIAANSKTTVTGERHWIRREDGSVWVLGLLDACRWGPDGPPDHAAFKALYPDIGYRGRPEALRLGPSLTYRFDDPVRPTRLDTWRTEALFTDGADGLRVAAQVAPGGGSPTETLPAAFPFLAEVEAANRAAREADRDQPVHRRPARLSPGRFMGMTAVAEQLRGEGCVTPDAEAGVEGPVVLAADARCQLGGDCRPDFAPDATCHERLGGLRPEFARDYSVVRFSLQNRDPAYVGGYLRGEVLRDAGAPGVWGPNQFAWRPQACLEDVCVEPRGHQLTRLYYPSRKILVYLDVGLHRADPNLFLARPGPVWGGNE